MRETNLNFIKMNIKYKKCRRSSTHCNENKGACSLPFLLFNWEKFKARRGVLSFSCYLTKNYSYFELLLLQYVFKKHRVP